MKTDGYVRIGAELETKNFDNGLNQLEGKLDAFAKSLTSKFSLGTVIGNAMTKLVGEIKGSVSSAIGRVDTLNNFSNIMGNLGINAKDSKEAIELMSEELVGLPTTLEQGARAVQRFTSVTGDVKGSTEMFLALNNAILAGGAPMMLQASALEQMSQAYARGKPDMMEWRNFMQTMPAQLKQISVAMGYAGAEQLGEALRSGDVSMNEFMLTITKLNKEGLKGFKNFEEQARTATGGIQTSLTNLKTAFSRAIAQILDSIGQANIAAFFNGIIAIINKVIPYIGAFVKVAMMAFAAIGRLFGIKAKKKVDDTKNSLAGAGASMSDLGNATSDASDGMSDASNSAKNLNKQLKQLASFDEMNVLRAINDATSEAKGNNTTVNVGDLTGIDLGSFSNLTGKANKKIDEIIKKILELKEQILLLGTAVGIFFLSLKIAKLVEFLSALRNGKGTLQNFTGGISLMAGGIVLLGGSIVQMMTHWDDMGKKEKIVTGAFSAIGAGAVALGYAIAAGVSIATVGIGLLIAAVVALVAAIGTWIYKSLTEEKRIDSVREAEKKLEEQKRKTKDAYNEYIDAVDRAEEAQKHLLEVQDQYKMSGEELYKQVEDGTLTYKNMNKEQREVYKAYLDNIQAQQDEVNSLKDWKKEKKKEEKANYDVELSKLAEKKAWDKYKESVVKAFESGKISAEDAQKRINNALHDMDETSRKTFMQDLPEQIKQGINPDKYETNFQKFKRKWNEFINGLKAKITIGTTGNISVSGGGGSNWAKGGIIYHNPIKLASGAVINQPNRGVPLRGAIGGESGMEGIIPLTDSQQMRLLGESIGRYITIQLTNINSMNGRVISKELKKIENENNFMNNF